MKDVQLAAPIFTALGKSMLMQDAVVVQFGAADGQTFNLGYDAHVVPALMLALSAHMQDLRPGVLSDEMADATRIKPKGARVAVTEQGPAILYDMGGFLLGMQLSEASAREMCKTLSQYLDRQ